MANAYDYLEWRGDLSFEVSPVNEVDLFLCAQLSAPDYTDIVPEGTAGIRIADAAKAYFRTHTEDVKNLGLLQSSSVLPMLREMGKSVRFRNAVLCGYGSRLNTENTEQFSAVTIRLTEKLAVISIRGTDDTIIGWKENFNLAVMEQIPAQSDALDYLLRIAAAYPDTKLLITGHSKGGNLSIYAASMAPPEVQDRILYAVGFDSPGFRAPFMTSDGYLRIRSRVITVLSQHSIVGLLLDLAGDHVIVSSTVSGPVAHDGFHWEVMGTRFLRKKQLSRESQILRAAVDDTLKEMDAMQRQKFIDGIFDILLASGAATLTELADQGLTNIIRTFLRVCRDPDVKKFFDKLIRQYFAAGKTLQGSRQELKKYCLSTGGKENGGKENGEKKNGTQGRSPAVSQKESLLHTASGRKPGPKG